MTTAKQIYESIVSGKNDEMLCEFLKAELERGIELKILITAYSELENAKCGNLSNWDNLMIPYIPSDFATVCNAVWIGDFINAIKIIRKLNTWKNNEKAIDLIKKYLQKNKDKLITQDLLDSLDVTMKDNVISALKVLEIQIK